MPHNHIRDHFLPPDRKRFLESEPDTGRVIVIAPTRASCETIQAAVGVEIETLLLEQHGKEIGRLARDGAGFGIVAGTGTGKTLSIRVIAEAILNAPLKVGVVNREREATPETPTWNVVIVTTGIARRWFQEEIITKQDTIVADEIHQTSAELELCLALGKRTGTRFIWLSATVDPTFYAQYLESERVIESSAFDPARAALVEARVQQPLEFLNKNTIRKLVREKRGVGVFLPTRAEVEQLALELGDRWPRLNTAFYHGGEPIRVIKPFLEGEVEKPFLLAMTAAGQSALNIPGLDTVVIYDARYANLIQRGRNVLSRQYLGPNEILQMAGRVHGRVQNGRVYILSDREIDFDSLRPEPPEFQLAGDSERIALTAAALGVDMTELDLPVPLDRRAYRDALRRLERRGIIEQGRLTQYGRDVEAMPVDRPWAELLVQAPDHLVPFIAVSSNVDSLHRMTRDDADLRGYEVPGSDHLTAYRVYEEAVNDYGYLGNVYGLPRHIFSDEMDEWANERGIRLKVIEDIALGTAAVYRTLELELPRVLPTLERAVIHEFTDLVARVMPFDLVIDQETARGERVRVGRNSLCNRWGAVAGRINYFADRFGRPRGAIEGTGIPMKLIQGYATSGDPAVELRSGKKGSALYVTNRTEYFGFVLQGERHKLRGNFPPSLVGGAVDALTEALLAGETEHPDQWRVESAARQLDIYWKKSGGGLEEIAPGRVLGMIRSQLEGIESYEKFLERDIRLDVKQLVPGETRAALEKLPAGASILGDTVPLEYEIEDGRGVARLLLKEGQARRVRERDLPELDRPLRFAVRRGRRLVARSDSLEELQEALAELKSRQPYRRKHRR